VTICDSLLSLLFFVPFVSVENLGAVFIPDEGPGGYEDVSVSVKGQKTYQGLRVDFCQGSIIMKQLQKKKLFPVHLQT